MAELTPQVLELVDTMDELGRLLDTETEALQTHNLLPIAGLIDRKISLGQIFERQLSWLSEQPELLLGLDEEQRTALSEASDRFNNQMLSNMAALDATQRASERVMSFVIDGVRRTTEDRGGYGPGQSRVGAPGPLSVSLNATL